MQVRLIVWRAKDVVAKDGVDQPTNQEVKEGADPTPKSSSWFSCCGCCCGGSSGSSDVYVTGQFEGMDDKKETDVNTPLQRGHHRCFCMLCQSRRSVTGPLGQRRWNCKFQLENEVRGRVFHPISRFHCSIICLCL